MELGRFSVSLKVADLQKSLAFYRMLGFAQVFGDPARGFVIVQNGEAKIGLFQGILQSNLLTFNPPDARGIQDVVRAAGWPIAKEAEPGEGPAHLVLTDPDGNAILIDQH